MNSTASSKSERVNAVVFMAESYTKTSQLTTIATCATLRAMKSRRETRAQLKAFVALCGGQKAAAAQLAVSPQFIGQLVHGLKPVPAAMIAYIEHRTLYGRPPTDEKPALLPTYRRPFNDNPAG